MRTCLWLLILSLGLILGGCKEEEENPPGRIWVGALAVAPDRGCVVAGVSQDSKGNGRLLVVRLESRGETRWAAEHDIGDPDFPVAMQVSADGGVLVLCGDTGYQAESADMQVLKVSSGGELEWQRNIATCPHTLWSAAPTPDGGFAAAGGGTSPTGGAGLTHVDESGRLRFCRGYGDSLTVSAVAPAEDGGFLLWAGFYTENGQLIRVDQNGDLIWMRQDVLFDRWFADLQGDGAGGFLLAGGQSYLEPMILRVNANGEAVQRFFNDGPLGGDAVSVSSTPDGGAVAACVRQVSFEAPRYSDGVVRFESNGALRWAVECTAESGSGEPKVRALADGTVIAAGAYDIVVDGKYGSALYVLKLSPEGQVVWRQTIEH